MSGPDVFISYSREDRNAARHFADLFAEEGFSVWWDAALHSGETFDEVIESALKASKAVVVLWSPRSVTSRWVRAEATLADRHHKLAPIMIEFCDRPIAFELTHTADLSNWDGNTSDRLWRSFIKDLRRLVERAQGEGGAASAQVNRGGSGGAAPFRPAERTPEQRLQDVVNRAAAERAEREPVFAPRTWGSPPVGGAARAFEPQPEPQPEPEEAEEEQDDSDRTRIYTRAESFAENDDVHCLELTIGDRLEKRFVVERKGLKIGRAGPADVILADSRVSRSHCIIELAGDELRVSDLNSTNGTFVDGERVDGSQVLPVGSELKVGSIVFKHEVRSRAEV